MDRYNISGYEVLEKTARPHGNGARVIVPKDWSGEQIKVVRTTSGRSDGVRISPVAAVMHDAVMNSNTSLTESMERVIRFKSFSDIDTEIVEDFQEALENPSCRQYLRQRSSDTDDNELSSFYAEISSSASNQKDLEVVLERWTH